MFGFLASMLPHGPVLNEVLPLRESQAGQMPLSGGGVGGARTYFVLCFAFVSSRRERKLWTERERETENQFNNCCSSISWFAFPLL